MDSKCLLPGKSGDPGLADSDGSCSDVFKQGFPRAVRGYHPHDLCHIFVSHGLKNFKSFFKLSCIEKKIL